MKNHSVFCVSDHTGVTVEAVAKSVLAQFPALEFSLIALPFIDSPEKAQAAAAQIAAIPGALVFSTLSDPALRAILRDSRANLFDVFGFVVPAVETALGQAATPSGGRTHGMANNYESRMDAVNFSLALDDGLQPQRLDQADLILVGVSRVGKTPTALYLALQYGLRVANYPLTPDDLEHGSLPDVLLANLPRLRALTLSAERLAAIRQARYPDSRYASLQQCRDELAAAERLFTRHAVPVIDTTRMSVEEIAARLRNLP
ncbi:pyruvate, water dikinase regulatory protein [Thiobacillus denitrificans]|uniref:Putative phosphoenolpyruvate synthase regulatory protein n=1 Tax=Thiobacillus denitrificans TaxID=36861 RepID=A0A106BSI2_THIDE|nr:pyruvate, water dikinase regulatory protein [Thiobacillus denitrificans]KVW97830.1 phosphoenolpyruvate synthase regulatory protein [Thiobacillus denitrificans]